MKKEIINQFKAFQNSNKNKSKYNTNSKGNQMNKINIRKSNRGR